MKYLRIFEKESDYTQYVGGSDDYVTPHVALIRDTNIIKCQIYEPELYTQVINLQEGWNYFSSYVETDLESLQKALGTNGVKIKDDNLYTDYYAEYDEWYGSLNSYSYNKMYMVKTSAACTIELTGKLINPLELPITIKPNTSTWISYPLNKEMSVTDALANFDAKDGDNITSNESGFAEYLEGYGWDGTLETLVPGEGYIFKTTNTDYSEDRILIYPSDNK